MFNHISLTVSLTHCFWFNLFVKLLNNVPNVLLGNMEAEYGETYSKLILLPIIKEKMYVYDYV